MKIVPKEWFLAIFFVITHLILLSLPIQVRADDLDRQQKALNIINNFGEKFCSDIPLKGTSSTTELNAEAKGQLKKLVTRIADLGFNAAAKYGTSKYEGLLQKDILIALQDKHNCKMQIWNDLKNKLLGKTDNKKAEHKAKKQTSNMNSTDNYKVSTDPRQNKSIPTKQQTVSNSPGSFIIQAENVNTVPPVLQSQLGSLEEKVNRIKELLEHPSANNTRILNDYLQSYNLESNYPYGFALFYSDGRKTLHYGLMGKKVTFDPSLVRVKRFSMDTVCIDTGPMKMNNSTLEFTDCCFTRGIEGKFRLVSNGTFGFEVTRLADATTGAVWVLGFTSQEVQGAQGTASGISH